MLSARPAWLIYGLTILCYAALAIADLYRPMPAQMAGQMAGMADMPGMRMPGLVDRMALHMHGMMLGYAVCAAVLVFMISRVRANLRARDEEVARLRTQALEQEHLMRLGLLTAGAAHELGTPLTTLSVIIKDWRDLGVPKARAERDEELATLDAQVLRCKAVISDILAASGQTRGEDTSSQPLKPFLAAICETWRGRHPDAAFDLRLDVGEQSIAADKVFEQSLINLLDNAFEASQSNGSTAVSLRAGVTAGRLLIEVGDRGPGFAPQILTGLGKPFLTTKDDGSGRPRGLGLFLVRNTAQALSGDLTIAGDATGARVRLEIPLASIGVGDAV
jgi:two-component system, sensor histidine kinase RegB